MARKAMSQFNALAVISASEAGEETAGIAVHFIQGTEDIEPWLILDGKDAELLLFELLKALLEFGLVLTFFGYDEAPGPSEKISFSGEPVTVIGAIPATVRGGPFDGLSTVRLLFEPRARSEECTEAVLELEDAKTLALRLADVLYWELNILATEVAERATDEYRAEHRDAEGEGGIF